MSGAVKTIRKVIEAPATMIERNVGGPFGDILKNTAVADLKNSSVSFGNFATGIEKGKPGQAVGGFITPYVARGKEVMGEFKGGMAGDQPAPLNIAAEDPAQVADEAVKKKSRAKRQAEIDILTDRPGRGGTILTDQYTYNV